METKKKWVRVPRPLFDWCWLAIDRMIFNAYPNASQGDDEWYAALDEFKHSNEATLARTTALRKELTLFRQTWPLLTFRTNYVYE